MFLPPTPSGRDEMTRVFWELRLDWIRQRQRVKNQPRRCKETKVYDA